MIVIFYLLTLVHGHRGSGTEVRTSASCLPAKGHCTGDSRAEANDMCCNNECDIHTIDDDVFYGRCADDPSPCKPEQGALCTGNSKDEANEMCCSGVCNIFDIDESCENSDCPVFYGNCAGRTGSSIPVPPSGVTSPSDNMVPAPTQGAQCRQLGKKCKGSTFGDADRQCCSGDCNDFAKYKRGVWHGYCVTPSEGGVKRFHLSEKKVDEGLAKIIPAAGSSIPVPPSGVSSPSDNMVPAPASSSPSPSGVRSPADNLVPVSSSTTSCVAEKGSCHGWSFNEAQAMCCGDQGLVCTITSLDFDASPPLQGYCSGPMEDSYEGGRANGVPPSGVSSPSDNMVPAPASTELSCLTLGVPCKGNSIHAANSQCCSGFCNYLEKKDGVYHGICYSR